MFWKKIPEDGYVDMHIHIVPNVDDGAATLDDAIAMAKMAFENGTRAMIATPHHHPHKVSCNHNELYELFLDFQQLVVREVPGLMLYYGREIYCNYDATDELIRNSEQREQLSLISMANTRYVLLEFDIGADYQYMMNQLQNIQMHGYWPILAHIERYECLAMHPERLEQLKAMNVVMQVNAATITGLSGKNLQRFVLNAIKDGYVGLVASDAHTVRTRNPKLRDAARVVGKKYGSAVVERIFMQNPRRIIEGKYMEE